jgi:hypothetical protein
VDFLPEVAEACRARADAGGGDLVAMITETLANDPRRAGARGGTYFVRLGTLDVQARREGEGWIVERIVDRADAAAQASSSATSQPLT